MDYHETLEKFEDAQADLQEAKLDVERTSDATRRAKHTKDVAGLEFGRAETIVQSNLEKAMENIKRGRKGRRRQKRFWRGGDPVGVEEIRKSADELKDAKALAMRETLDLRAAERREGNAIHDESLEAKDLEFALGEVADDLGVKLGKK